MTLFRALSAVVIGVSALATGCFGGAGDLDAIEAHDYDDPSLSTLGGLNGSGGFNNLRPAAFHANKWSLYEATKSALATYNADDGSWSLANNTYTNALLATADGREVLKYAVRCALSSTVTVKATLPDGTIVAYAGQSILAQAVNWKTAALNHDQADALFTCLVAHMNANGVTVPINLSGSQVTNQAVGYDPAFSWEEALWAVKIIDEGDASDVTFHLYAWPMNNMAGCAEYVSGLQSRICAKSDDNCGLTVRLDRDSACEEAGGLWSCDDASGHPLPAILTKLKAVDVPLMYSDCDG